MFYQVHERQFVSVSDTVKKKTESVPCSKDYKPEIHLFPGDNTVHNAFGFPTNSLKILLLNKNLIL